LGGGVVMPVAQRRLNSNAELRAMLKEVVDAGGEGLMLHRADAPLASGRSDLLLKLKPPVGCRSRCRRPPAGPGSLCRPAGRPGGSDARGHSLQAGHGLQRGPAPRSAAHRRHRHLSLPRPDGQRQAALCELSACGRNVL